MANTPVSTAQATHREVSESATCQQCGKPVSEGTAFCCGGCEAAYNAMQSAEADQAAFSPMAETLPDGNHVLTVQVDGIHCASCVQRIESNLSAHENVTSARVNFTTRRLTLQWSGDVAQCDDWLREIAALGYEPSAVYDSGEDSEDRRYLKWLLRCIAVSGFAAGNIMLLSVALWTTTSETMGIATRDLLHWLSALIALPCILYAGRPFFRSAFGVLRHGHTNMDVPISLAVLLAGGMSLSETWRHGEHVYFDSALMLLFFLLIGRYLDARARGKARESAEGLLSMMTGTATVLTDGQPEQVAIRDLREGMLVQVAPGQHIPADGEVASGMSEIDKSLITGETLPEPVSEGDTVYAGTTNLNAALQIRLTKASQDSVLADIVRLMDTAAQSKSRYVRIADKAAQLYTPVVHTLGLATFLGWWLMMGVPWQQALMYAVTVLIITCPCALGLAVPVVQVLASNVLMLRGVLLKSGDALERLSQMTAAVFDKTGTLTIGKPSLVDGAVDGTVMELAASMAVQSHHPLAQALSAAYDGERLAVPVTEHGGKGLEASYDGRVLRLGSRAWCGDANAAHDDAYLELWFADGDGAPVRFRFADRLRDDAKEVMATLQGRGIATMMLTGDRASVAEQVAEEAGIASWKAEVSPVEKHDMLAAMRDDGQQVLMVGDGMNDAPALTVAHVSMSPSSAIDIAQNAADIVFQGDKLSAVLVAWRVACASMTLVRQNFMLAVVYNLFAIPLAVLGHVTPMIAAIAMSGSSLIVIANSFRINRMTQ